MELSIDLRDDTMICILESSNYGNLTIECSSQFIIVVFRFLCNHGDGRLHLPCKCLPLAVYWLVVLLRCIKEEFIDLFGRLVETVLGA
jgi:hypothetical protein